MPALSRATEPCEAPVHTVRETAAAGDLDLWESYEDFYGYSESPGADPRHATRGTPRTGGTDTSLMVVHLPDQDDVPGVSTEVDVVPASAWGAVWSDHYNMYYNHSSMPSKPWKCENLLLLFFCFLCNEHKFCTNGMPLRGEWTLHVQPPE